MPSLSVQKVRLKFLLLILNIKWIIFKVRFKSEHQMIVWETVKRAKDFFSFTEALHKIMATEVHRHYGSINWNMKLFTDAAILLYVV